MQKENTTQAQQAQSLLQELVFCNTPSGFQETLHQFLTFAFVTDENLSKKERESLCGDYMSLIAFFDGLKQLKL